MTLSIGGRIKPGSKYRAVEVSGLEPGCCNAVRAIAGRRYLTHEIPRLPLAGCDATQCRCSYELFEDRRTGTRRVPAMAPGTAYQLRTWDDRNGLSTGRRHDD